MKKNLLLLILTLIFSKTAQTNQSPQKNLHQQENCYGYLTELVRSSNFPFDQTERTKTNLIIDNDTGDTVLARLVFETRGTGTIGWIEYHVYEKRLFNVSAQLEDPELLKFNLKFSVDYENCINYKKNIKTLPK